MRSSSTRRSHFGIRSGVTVPIHYPPPLRSGHIPPGRRTPASFPIHTPYASNTGGVLHLMAMYFHSPGAPAALSVEVRRDEDVLLRTTAARATRLARLHESRSSTESAEAWRTATAGRRMRRHGGRATRRHHALKPLPCFRGYSPADTRGLFAMPFDEHLRGARLGNDERFSVCRRDFGSQYLSEHPTAIDPQRPSGIEHHLRRCWDSSR